MRLGKVLPSAAKRAPYALPGSSFLFLPPHTFERLRSSTRRDSTTHPNTQCCYKYERATCTHQTSLTSHASACSLFFTTAYHVARAVYSRRPATCVDASYSTASQLAPKPKRPCRGQGHARGFRSTLRIDPRYYCPSPVTRTRHTDALFVCTHVPRRSPRPFSRHTPPSLSTLSPSTASLRHHHPPDTLDQRTAKLPA